MASIAHNSWIAHHVAQIEGSTEMAGLWEFVGDTLGETLGAARFGPIVLGAFCPLR
jgi:hypothetical protein